jgi:WD40 repeat protein
LDAEDHIDFVKDAHGFLVHSKEIIESRPLQTYASALLFSPSGSLIRTAFQHEEPSWIAIQPDISRTWGSCLHTFEEHCHGVAFSQDSNRLILGFWNGIIKIWDTDSNTHLLELRIHESDCEIDRVRFFDKSSKFAVILDGDEAIEIWDVATGRYLSTYRHDKWASIEKFPFCNERALQAFANDTGRGSFNIFDTDQAMDLSFLTSPHHDRRNDRREVTSIFSPLGRFLAVNFKPEIKIWDATGNRHIQSLKLPLCNKESSIPGMPFMASAWLSDAALLAVGLSNRTVVVFSVNDGDILHMLHSGAGSTFEWPRTVTISYDSRKVASSSGPSSLRIWDLSNTSNPRTLVADREEIKSIAFSSDSERLVSCSWTGEAKIWDIRGEDCSQTLDDHQSGIVVLSLSNDSTYLASGADDSTVKIWDLHGRCLQTLHGHSSLIKRVDFFHHPERVGSLSDDNTYRIWDIVSGQCLHVYECGYSTSKLAVSPDLRILARMNGTLKTGKWSIQLKDIIDDVSLPTLQHDSAAYIYSLAFPGESTQLAVLDSNDIVRIFHTRSGECLQILDGKYKTSEMPRYRSLGGCPSVAFSSDATRLVSSRADGTILVWDSISGSCLHTFEISTPSLDVSYDQSGKFLLTKFGRIAISELSDLEEHRAAPTTHSPEAHGGGLSLDGKWITYNSVNILWLLPEYRRDASIIGGDSIVFGNSVGVAAGRKLWIFTLFPEFLE